MTLPAGWAPYLWDETNAPYWDELQRFVAMERSTHVVYPPRSQVFAALHATAPAETKVVILGQDPYHGPGQAHGLSFSVPHGIRVPPSLRTIHRELGSDLGVPMPPHGCLETWARQGVLLLNTTLTVRAGAPGSHQRQGWEQFTDRLIAVVNAQPEPVVFLLWGAAARQKAAMVDCDRHLVIASAHPSPLSARRGFLGSRPFSRSNEFLSKQGRTAVDWGIDAPRNERDA